MKLFLIFIFTIFLFSFSNFLLAAPTATPSVKAESDKLEKIRELKEKVAQKVSQLRKENKTVVMGEIKSIASDNFVLITNDGEKTVTTDKESRYYWVNTDGKLLVLTFNNFEKGDFIVVSGEIDENDKIIAKILLGKTPTFYISGVVAKPVGNEKNLTISLKEKSSPISVAISESTKITFFNKKDKEIFAGKFSDIKAGEKVIVRGVYKGSNKEEILAKRIFVY